MVLQNHGNADGAIYVGELFISDSLQKMKLIFDTGSDYLAVTSSLCSDKHFAGKKQVLATNGATTEISAEQWNGEAANVQLRD